ncbi:MEDS domain-containing protein [Bacillus infantis]|uniref:MEDS domain-containing protein n=1 Tax=Bacillus infantis TaxID=324767 RepID=UPI003CFA69B7
MDSLIVDLYHEYKKNNGGHICYLYNQEENYINNAVSFVMAGIKNGDFIFLLENDRNLRLIQEKLQKELNTDQLSNLLVMNNYDFYYAQGNFHPHIVVSEFLKTLEPHLDKKTPISTWGLVEWREDKEIYEKLTEYEQQVDKSIKEKGFISVCVYPAGKTPDSFRKALHNCHNIVINDEEVMHLS